MSQPVEAEALFGSAARNDQDWLSDIDYLIVGDDGPSLRRRKAWLTKQGFSVSDFTWKRLERAFSEGTLFALHLKLEARLIFDPKGKLRSLFESFRPKSDYVTDFARSLELFRPLSHVPAAPWGGPWALDVLSVGFRNSAIMTLANEGEFFFSNRAILDALQKRGRINKDQLGTLQELRFAKVRYRAGRARHIGKRTIDRAIQAVEAALLVEFDFKTVTGDDIASAQKNSTCAYAWMRTIEAELLTASARRIRDEEASNLRLELMKNLTDPHAYLWRFMHDSRSIECALEKIRSFY
jgi:predicted nucleotidyltransferase